MTDDTYDDDELDTQQRDDANIKELRRKAKNHDDAVARAEQAERRAAIAEAGLTLNDVQRRALSAAHDGEWTADAIKATAADLGFVKPDAPDETTIPAAEQDAHQRVIDASAGANTPPAAPQLADQIATAATPAELDALLTAKGVDLYG